MLFVSALRTNLCCTFELHYIFYVFVRRLRITLCLLLFVVIILDVSSTCTWTWQMAHHSKLHATSDHRAAININLSNVKHGFSSALGTFVTMLHHWSRLIFPTHVTIQVRNTRNNKRTMELDYWKTLLLSGVCKN